MRLRIAGIVTSLLIAGLTPGSATASTFTVDQSQTNIADFIGATDPIVAQTFTAGRYGPMDSIDVYLSGHPAHATLELRGVTGSPAIPNATVLGTVNLGLNDSGPQWTRFTFSNGPIVIPGHQYSFFLYLTGSTNSLWGATTDVYHRGRALMFYSGAWHYFPDLYSGAPADLAFRTNVGPAAPTPTPRPATHAPAVATASPSSAATDAATDAATAAPTDTATAATPTALSTDPIAAVQTGGSASPAPQTGPSGGSSSDSGGLPVPLLAGAILVLVLLGGGLFAISRRRKPAQS